MPTVVLAQEAPEDERPWKNKAELGLVVTSGNSESESFALSNEFEYAWDKAQLTIDASAIRVSNTKRTAENVAGELVVTKIDETTVETYALSGKYRRALSERMFWYARAGWIRDVQAGIDSRYGVGGGFGYRFFETDRHSLLGEAGVDYTDESLVNGASDSFAGLRVGLDYARTLSETAEWTSELDVNGNLDDTDDLRAVWANAVTASLTTKMALKAGYTIKFDNRPVVDFITTTEIDPGTGLPYEPVPFEFDKVDTILSASLVINF
jgi:putative salt-induced outer membrane protein